MGGWVWVWGGVNVSSESIGISMCMHYVHVYSHVLLGGHIQCTCMDMSVIPFYLPIYSLSTEEGEDSKRPLGFQDFMAPTKSGRKKRTLPIAPQRRNREEGEEDGE